MNPPMMSPYPPVPYKQSTYLPPTTIPPMPRVDMPPPMSFGSDVVPKESLYINNLNDKIKPDELKISLYFLFSPFGEILTLICNDSWNLRGQAFIIYKSTVAATQALKALQGFIFFDRPLKINYTKERSEILAKMEGTWVSKDRPKITKRGVKMIKKKVKTEENSKEDNNNTKVGVIKTCSKAIVKELDEDLTPNNVLYVQNVPNFATEEMLKELFKQYPGFKEVRLIATKEIAFVEYDEEPQASIALAGLNHFKIMKDREIFVSYAKV